MTALKSPPSLLSPQPLWRRIFSGRPLRVIDLSLFCLDAGSIAWLLFAQRSLAEKPMLPWAGPVAIAVLSAACAFCLRLHAPVAESFPRLALKAAGLALGVCFACLVVRACGWPAPTPAESLWLAVATTVVVPALRLVLFALAPAGRDSLFEAARWLVLLAAATWLFLPFYTPRPIGAGDAYWYQLMLSDFVTQIRHGVFPVWIGQSEYAFNGATSPLRIAPWFQHAGALLDFLTFRSLEFTALKNAVLIVNSLAVAFCAYFCFRAMLPSRRNAACALALIYVFSPAVLAPLCVGDQYMTFLAAPFLPVVCYGLWRTLKLNDAPGHVMLGAGVSGLWLSHTPIALWASFFAALIYAAKLLRWRASGREIRLTLLSAGVFLLLGFFPILSALTLDNVNLPAGNGAQAAEQVRGAFPANFRYPPSPHLDQPSDYRTGYAALAVFLLAWVLIARRREFVAAYFAGAALLVLMLLVPLPHLNEAIWRHLPLFVMQMTNIWPGQRLFLIAATFMLFALAAALSAPPAARARSWRAAGLGLVSLAMLAWAVHEGLAYPRSRLGSIPRRGDWNIDSRLHNTLLTRYTFAALAYAPSYFSHGYMDPFFENRLLERETKRVFLQNADCAAPAAPQATPGRTPCAEGVFRAINDNHTTYYNLEPKLRIESRQRYALRLDFLGPIEGGWLQIKGDGIFREYLLPDSGVDMTRRLPSSAFGALPTSSRVVSLYTDASAGAALHLIRIDPSRAITPSFDFARYHLWEFRPEDLPIFVHDWMPYRAWIDTPKPAYLETPRLWQGRYRATVNGRLAPVLRSPDNLAMMPVDAGRSEVVLQYDPPLLLQIFYWACLAAWVAVAVFGLRALFLAARLNATAA